MNKYVLFQVVPSLLLPNGVTMEIQVPPPPPPMNRVYITIVHTKLNETKFLHYSFTYMRTVPIFWI